MRGFSAVVAGLVAVVAALVTVPLLWVSAHVADEDGYLAFSSELATDAELQGAFAAYLADDFVQRGLLPAPLQEPAAAALTIVARQTANEPGFVDSWEQTQQSFHRSAFSGDDGGALRVDVSPMAQFVVDRVGDQLPVSLQVPEGMQVSVGTAGQRDRVQWVSKSTTFGLLGLLVVVVAGVTSLLSARSRPSAVAGLGLGALVTAGVLQVLTSEATPRLLDEVEGTTAFARALQELLVDRAADSLSGWLGWIAVAGAAAVVVGLAARALTGRPARS